MRTLRVYSLDSDETAHEIVSELKISYEHLQLIKENLERFGLLQSKNEEINEDNLEQIVKYLQDIKKERLCHNKRLIFKAFHIENSHQQGLLCFVNNEKPCKMGILQNQLFVGTEPKENKKSKPREIKLPKLKKFLHQIHIKLHH